MGVTALDRLEDLSDAFADLVAGLRAVIVEQNTAITVLEAKLDESRRMVEQLTRAAPKVIEFPQIQSEPRAEAEAETSSSHYRGREEVTEKPCKDCGALMEGTARRHYCRKCVGQRIRNGQARRTVSGPAGGKIDQRLQSEADAIDRRILADV